MKLYIYDHCPFCVRPRLAFGLKQVAFETTIVMEDDVETPTRLIGRKVVPILQKADGTHMAESLDIVRHVDRLGEPMFDRPSDPALDEWGETAGSLGPKLFIPRFTRGDFTELATVQARGAYLRRKEKASGDMDALLAETPLLVPPMNAHLEALAPLVDGRETYGISDILLWPTLRSLSIVKDLRLPDAVRAYAERLGEKGNVPLLFDQAM